jgi:hypothetical protein
MGYILFCTVKFPAVSRALDASRGKFVRTTEAAMVSGASVVSSSSGIRSSWPDMLYVRLEGLYITLLPTQKPCFALWSECRDKREIDREEAVSPDGSWLMKERWKRKRKSRV